MYHLAAAFASKICITDSLSITTTEDADNNTDKETNQQSTAMYQELVKFVTKGS